MPLAREVGKVVFAAGTIPRTGMPTCDESVGNLVGPARINEPHMAGGKHSRDGAPSRGDNGQVMRQRLDQREWLAFVGVSSGKAEYIGAREEHMFFCVIGKARMLNDAGTQCGGLRIECLLVALVRETAGDHEPKSIRFAPVRNRHGGERVEQPLRGSAKAEKQNLRG